MSSVPAATILGFPRMGSNRQLKKAVEAFWASKISESELLDRTKQLRKEHWELQASLGLKQVPVGDFSFYDHMLDHAVLFGIVPERYNVTKPGLECYFAMARGLQAPDRGIDVPSLEMVKWFDTNYHYMVPQIAENQTFALDSTKIIDELREALALGLDARPVVVGPVTFLKLSKTASGAGSTLSYLPQILPLYVELIKQLVAEGAKWVQLDEPVLALDIDAETQEAYRTAYAELAKISGAQYLVATYFAGLEDNLELAASLPIQALHLDLVRNPEQLEGALKAVPESVVLSLGVINGRNIWKADLSKGLELINTAAKARPADKLIINSSCSLLHTPHSLDAETELDAELKNWLAFSTEKIAEIVVLSRALHEGVDAVKAELDANAAAIQSRRTSDRVSNPAVKSRVVSLKESDFSRNNEFSVRQAAQHDKYKLPLFPTTTIGSFPQTSDIRRNRARFRKSEITAEQYQEYLETATRECIEWQDNIGIDVLVHGEFERNDMVEFFGENLSGFAFTRNGWVQSYGSRCVKPPVIYGDVSRTRPITVETAKFAQTCSPKPVKGMLTGPVTILQWSFVRDDQPRSETCKQIALAIRDEVVDLETAGTTIIQVDEPAIREGLPLRKSGWDDYLEWSVDSFRLATAGVVDSTQIHTHMCYSEFNTIFPAIQRMDADVITIENAKSDLKLLHAFEHHGYKAEIGPGLYDIHSPRVPSVQEMKERVRKMLNYLSPQLLWINPDCGLKTRGWEEVRSSLTNLVEVARELRKEY
ncbi:methionine-synthesizing 5- methyltetrahydropteroyltriglutamate--homocysteine methyltransferase [Spiromyces aspiralis]|uniref:Methionine-synthesizing 5-methyltetrahydropteroyltriglutamate--homocysteine methyltransferase n=1 Tax=Spiromyces aspiralis TaxID=68401 RepID=A0ACC1HGM7_9FUNG|nr:methionine-synthesizing 5- methyltetrahydropteroyltriglutamate--homocysteine methyltransferase [Spiromyces aspiralis]